MTETWRPIPGFEGRYEASDLGMVRSVSHTCIRRNGASYRVRGKLLTRVPSSCGRYFSVTMGRGKVLKVHRVIALAFLGPRPTAVDVAHLNGDGRDNRLTNLVYCSRTTNMAHMLAHGRRPAGERHSNCRLSLGQVSEIRARRGNGEQCKSLAAEFGLSRGYVSDLANFKERVSPAEFMAA